MCSWKPFFDTILYKQKRIIINKIIFYTWQNVCSHDGAWIGSCKTPLQIEPEYKKFDELFYIIKQKIYTN